MSSKPRISTAVPAGRAQLQERAAAMNKKLNTSSAVTEERRSAGPHSQTAFARRGRKYPFSFLNGKTNAMSIRVSCEAIFGLRQMARPHNTTDHEEVLDLSAQYAPELHGLNV
ncbi:hypothetical protein GPALN_003346 [Globodera pallida]|uniref:Uncharacterized protein n=1 Tax=Globodera pallida TaxID=36090 RepID=A0A183C3F9_GLOPA|nr:hypothetical protein GPALN_003346 [Globodera pallida]